MKTVELSWRETRQHTAHVNVADDWQPDGDTPMHLAAHEVDDTPGERDNITYRPARFRSQAPELGEWL